MPTSTIQRHIFVGLTNISNPSKDASDEDAATAGQVLFIGLYWVCLRPQFVALRDFISESVKQNEEL